MGNHNILITNPLGERKHQFADNVSRDDCEDWLEEYGPAPIGWMYQIVNLNRKKRVHPEKIVVIGLDKEGKPMKTIEARHKTNNGWYSVRMAKRDLRKQGCSFFKLEKVWSNAEQSEHNQELLQA